MSRVCEENMTTLETLDGLVIVPPEQTLKMRAQPILPPRVKGLWRHLFMKAHENKGHKPWHDEAYASEMRRRRRLVAGLVFVTTGLGLLKWAAAMPSDASAAMRTAVIILFVMTFGWIALYFWSSILGFAQLLKQAKAPGLLPAGEDVEILAKTAVLMPIYNEDPAQVMARLAAVGEDLAKAGAGDKYDVFVLSDTTNPKIWVKEEKIWLEVKKRLEPGIRAYYRRRAVNTARKSGNIEDFCNRWGAAYDFMLVLDADSLMTAETIMQMTRLMERNAHAGIIQAPPQTANAQSLFARMQQFAGRVAGPIVSAGLAYWQGGDSNYWGHNAIIRTQAFINCCGLPKLKGRGPFGGYILSHDFVEAALISRGGWSAWLLPELKGSYEECPPSVIDFAARDRRWCQGNMQHLKILVSRKLNPVSRVHFMIGIMSYLSSPLWLLFLLSGLLMVLSRAAFPPEYFGSGYSLFPTWPVFDKFGTIVLFALSMGMLLLPKFLGLIIYVREEGRRRLWNGGKSLGLEIAVSTLIAPIMMMFQSKFVFDIFCGKAVGWNTQNRGDEGTDWRTAWQIHKWQMFLGFMTAAAVWQYAPVMFWWLSPITLGLVLSVPLSVLTSRVSLGCWLQKHGWFVTPEEEQPPQILLRAAHWAGVLTPFEAGNGGIEMLRADGLLRELHRKMLPVNGPAPQALDEFAEAAAAKVAAGRLDELTKEEEMWALYHRAG